MSTYYVASLLPHIKPLQNLMVSNNHLFAPIWQCGWGLVKPSISEPNDISLGRFYWSWRIHYKVIHSHGWQTVFHCQPRTSFLINMNHSTCLLGLPNGMASDSKKGMETPNFLRTGFQTGTVSLLPHSVGQNSQRSSPDSRGCAAMSMNSSLLSLWRDQSVSPSLWIFIEYLQMTYTSCVFKTLWNGNQFFHF